MHLALDYDDTFTADKSAWECFIQLFQTLGHTITIVTMRDGEADWHSDFKYLKDTYDVNTVFCNGESKRDVTERLGIKIDVWIDDRPEGISHGSTFAFDKLEEWRADQIATGGIEAKVA